MNILIADDEPPARERLARLLEQLPDYHLLPEQAGNGLQALELCKKLQPDIVLLDIQMPGLDGLQVAEQLLHAEHTPAVVFCTAHDEFAIPAFAVNAAGYLVKPVRLEQLQQMLSALPRLNAVQRTALHNTPASPTRCHITARTHKGLERIALDDILYFQAEHKYVTVYHLSGETLIDEPLKSLETEFASQLVRIHRSTLVNASAMQRLERLLSGQYQLHLGHDTLPLPVSRRHVTQVRERMQRL